MPRPKKPATMRQLEGIPGQSRIPPAVKKGSVPECPKWLSGIAVEEWNRVATGLHQAGLLSMLDESALESYCVTYAKWREAEQRLADEGLTILTPNGCVQAHPCQSISNQAQKLLLAWVKAFGLSPDSRGRMDVSSSPQVQADADFLVKIKNSVGR